MVKRFIVGAALATTIIASAMAQSSPIGHPLPAGCWTNVAINTGHGFPTEAIETILDNGGDVHIEGVGDESDRSATIQLTVKRWTLFEDSELWIDLLDYESEGTCNELSGFRTFLSTVSR